MESAAAAAAGGSGDCRPTSGSGGAAPRLPEAHVQAGMLHLKTHLHIPRCAYKCLFIYLFKRCFIQSNMAILINAVVGYFWHQYCRINCLICSVDTAELPVYEGPCVTDMLCIVGSLTTSCAM